jgi:transposase
VDRGDPTNAQWAQLEPLMPVSKKPGRPPKWTKRQLSDGIRWRTRTGVPWRDMPERYGARTSTPPVREKKGKNKRSRRAACGANPQITGSAGRGAG